MDVSVPTGDLNKMENLRKTSKSNTWTHPRTSPTLHGKELEKYSHLHLT
jgi:hypothetical protein